MFFQGEAPMVLHSHAFFTVKAVGAVTVVKFTTPDLNDNVAETVGPELVKLAEQVGSGELRLDLNEVNYLSSTALGKLVVLKKRIASAGGKLALVNVNDFPYDLFRLTRLVEVLDVRPKRLESEICSTASA
jgi:anti-sigma B factor antagonist